MIHEPCAELIDKKNTHKKKYGANLNFSKSNSEMIPLGASAACRNSVFWEGCQQKVVK